MCAIVSKTLQREDPDRENQANAASDTTKASRSEQSFGAGLQPWLPGSQSDFPRLAGGTIPFMRKYSTI